jgi:general nucleoside transport system permease protein
MGDLIVSLADSTLRVASPLVLAALGGLFSERSGIVNIGLEGMMLSAAFAAAATAAVTGSPWLGLLAAILAGMLMALIHAYASISQNGNQMVSGMAVNILASGITPVLAIHWFEQGGRIPLAAGGRFTSFDLPFAADLVGVPIIGPLYSDIISGHTALVYITAIIVPVVAFVVYRTRFGLRLRAVGENPGAVDTAGVSVARMRYLALVVCGVLCGVAGAYLSIAHGSGFQPEMSAGKGYLALAALIFGKWRPIPTLLACLLFAFTDAVQIRLQGVELPIVGAVPVQAIQALPFVLTVLLLAGFVGKAVAPKMIGVPYVKDR